jgi:hypothetical protein
LGPKAISTICSVTLVIDLSDVGRVAEVRGDSTLACWEGSIVLGESVLGASVLPLLSLPGSPSSLTNSVSLRGVGVLRLMRMHSSHTNSNFMASACCGGLNDCSRRTSVCGQSISTCIGGGGLIILKQNRLLLDLAIFRQYNKL